MRLPIWLVALVCTACPPGSFGQHVTGKIVGAEGDTAECKIYIAPRGDERWSESSTFPLRVPPETIKLGQPFDVAFVLHGPSDRDHAIEISCPGYKDFRGPFFKTPSIENQHYSLETVHLEKLEAPATSKQNGL